MTDLEITKACAVAMELSKLDEILVTLNMMQSGASATLGCTYDPLHNDAQAMALVKKFEVSLYFHQGLVRAVSYKHDGITIERDISDLNRAICECVAKMQSAI